MKKTTKKAAKHPKVPPNTLVSAPSHTDRDYEAEDALRTLTRAEKIRSDKGMMRRVTKHHRDETRHAARALRLEGKRI